MASKTIVITGGNGFVGRHLVEELRREAPDVKVVVWDKSIQGLADGVQGVEVDITQPESYEKSLVAERPVWIAHLAAVPSAALASQNKEWAWQVNVEGTRQLLEEVRRVSPATRVLAVSSADIYGQGSDIPLSELPLERAKPRNPYAWTKWEMEKMIERDFNKWVVRVRPFPHVGPGQGLGFVTADFASQIAEIEAKGEMGSVIKVGNLEAKRDFTDVRDVARAYRLLMKKGVYGEACPAAERERGICGVYHIASGRAESIENILNKLLALSRVEIKVEQDADRMRKSDIPVLVGDATKLKEAMARQDGGQGWQPKISLDTSLEDILNYWREKVAVVSN